MIEINGSCIAIEKEYSNSGGIREQLSLYDEDGSCYGDFDITLDEVFSIKNPLWLSDTFVFSKKHFEYTICGDIETICYIKLNCYNKIEEIGSDFASRFHFDDYNAVLSRKDVTKAEKVHQILFTMIGDEYWLKLYRLKQKNTQQL